MYGTNACGNNYVKLAYLDSLAQTLVRNTVGEICPRVKCFRVDKPSSVFCTPASDHTFKRAQHLMIIIIIKEQENPIHLPKRTTLFEGKFVDHGIFFFCL